MIEKFKATVGRYLFRDEGGKKVLNKKFALLTGIFLITICGAIQVVPTLWDNNIPQGGIRRSDVPLVQFQDETPAQSSTKRSNRLRAVGDLDWVAEEPVEKKVIAHHQAPIRYAGKQVFYPNSNTEKVRVGTKLTGKLLTSIDTRSPERVHVLLLYGGSHKSGRGSIPPDTILLGQINYSGQDERVFITFTRAVLPDGREISIQAQALSSKDYRMGVIGEYHSNKGGQMASTIGLSMVGGISEVMIKREKLGHGNAVAPRATIRNGIYNGINKMTEVDVSEQATQLTQAPSYVTIDSGADLIISLEEGADTSERHE